MADVPILRISPAEKEAEEKRLENRKRDAWNESDSCGAVIQKIHVYCGQRNSHQYWNPDSKELMITGSIPLLISPNTVIE